MNRRQFAATSVTLMTWTLVSCEPTDSNRPSVFVSILPMKYFVARIAGDRIAVEVMAGPGQSPATYEPLPHQMLALARAKAFFRIGVPFEDAWIDDIKRNNPSLRIVDVREGIELVPMDTIHEIAVESTTGGNVDSYGAADSGEHEAHDHSGLDPHIWLAPQLVKRQAATICESLCELEPSSCDLFSANLAAFNADLDRLHDEIVAVFEPLTSRRMMVFHPAWGYFAREFGLTQLPIEIEGKEPGPQELALVIETARSEGIRVIFVQSQFAADTARAVAEAIDGAVVPIDPLAEDYIANLRAAATSIAQALGDTTHGQ